MKKFNFKKHNVTCKHASKKVYRQSINVKVDANTKSINTLKDDVKNLTEAGNTLADRFNQHEKVSADVLVGIGATASAYVSFKLVDIVLENRRNKKLNKNIGDLNRRISDLYERLGYIEDAKESAEEKKHKPAEK